MAKICRFVFLCSALLVCSARSIFSQQAEITENKDSSRATFQQYVLDFSKDSTKEDLRKKIIEIAVNLDPAPAIPEEAQRAMARAKIAFKNAQTPPEFNKAADEFLKAANLAPWWPDAYFNLGLVREKQAYYELAIANFNYYLMAAPAAEDARQIKEKIYQLEYLNEQRAKAIEIGNQAVNYQNSGRYEEALPLFKEAIKLDPHHADLRAFLGATYVSLNRYQEAIPELKEAIRLGKKELTTYFRLGLAYENAEQNLDEAIDTYEEGIRVDPDPEKPGLRGPLIASVYRNLAYDHQRKGNYEKAIHYYQLAIDNNHQDKAAIQEAIQYCKNLMGK